MVTRGALPTVLVVEDEPPIRTLLKDGLAFEGFKVTTATNGLEALEMLDHDGFDVILLDLMLPGMSGIELAQAIRRRCSITIIAMSASEQMLDKAKKQPAIDEAVSKPFEWDRLVKNLAMAVA